MLFCPAVAAAAKAAAGVNAVLSGLPLLLAWCIGAPRGVRGVVIMAADSAAGGRPMGSSRSSSEQGREQHGWDKRQQVAVGKASMLLHR